MTAVMTRVSGAILILIGIVLLAGGVQLITLGGSLYYAVTGAVVMISGVLYWRGARWGERLYALMLIGSLVWAVWEAGANPWALTARLFAPAVLGLWLAMPWVRRGLNDLGDTPAWRSEAAIATALILVLLVVRFVQFENAAEVDGPPSPVAADQTPAPADTDWQHYGYDLNAKRFSTLTQINAQNVDKLKVAWVHNSGDMNKGEATPIKIGDSLYTCTPHGIVVAIDAKTGKEKWRDDPRTDVTKYALATCRGVSYYRVPDGNGVCAERIIAAGPGGVIRALDTATGSHCADFGTNGVVDLLVDLGKFDINQYSQNSAPTVVAGKIIVGSFINDDYDADMASGVIRAYDAKTGALVWAWDMGAPDRIGPPSAGETYTRSTPNAWAAFAADEALDLVYVPTGNPSTDIQGSKRRPFDEKYGSSLVALNISDGRARWSFQTTHHDLWDLDVPAQPTLVDLPGPDGVRPAILQPTKRGDVLVLDRRDGTPIIPVKEIPVPTKGALPEETISPTQPISDVNFIPPPMTEAQMWGATPIDQMMCRIAFKGIRYEGPYTPPGLDTVLIFPGPVGGIDWAGVSVDDDNKVMVANTHDIPVFVQLIPREKTPNLDGHPKPAYNTPYTVRIGMFMGPLYLPCLQPPWGHLAAVDLKTGKTLWNRVIGTAQDSGPLGTRIGPKLLVGTPNQGAALTTRGGVAFHAATLDQYLRAYDVKTGKKLWEHRLPAGGQSTPMTYMAGGKQYIVMTAGGHGLMGTKLGDATIAFTLPDN